MESRQTFFEVFPDYKPEGDLYDALSDMQVMKVVMRQNERRLVVHLKGRQIMRRKLLNKVAFDLKNQLFGKSSVFLAI